MADNTISTSYGRISRIDLPLPSIVYWAVGTSGRDVRVRNDIEYLVGHEQDAFAQYVKAIDDSALLSMHANVLTLAKLYAAMWDDCTREMQRMAINQDSAIVKWGIHYINNKEEE